METKSSSLTGPLWVIAVGILILGIGACFTGYMLWDGKQETKASSGRPPDKTAEAGEVSETDPEALRLRRQQMQSDPAKSAKTGSIKPDESRPVDVAERASAPVQTDATVVLPPPSSPAPALPAVSGGALSRPLGGLIFGRVTLRGTPAPEKPLPLDAMCGALHPPAKPPTTRFYAVSADGGLADVFVYLRSGTGGRKYPLSTNAPVIDQRGCVFTPHVIGLQVGQSMIVRNSDPLLHNNHFTPTVQGNPEINKAQMPRGADQIYKWPQPEVLLRLKCDVHPWMFAYVGVVDHPFFAVTDETGRFQFAAPPPGKYVIEAVHRKTHQSVGTGVQREFNLGANENLQIDFEITVPAANQ